MIAAAHASKLMPSVADFQNNAPNGQQAKVLVNNKLLHNDHYAAFDMHPPVVLAEKHGLGNRSDVAYSAATA
jgi:hypothetical protein